MNIRDYHSGFRHPEQWVAMRGAGTWTDWSAVPEKKTIYFHFVGDEASGMKMKEASIWTFPVVKREIIDTKYKTIKEIKDTKLPFNHKIYSRNFAKLHRIANEEKRHREYQIILKSAYCGSERKVYDSLINIVNCTVQKIIDEWKAAVWERQPQSAVIFVVRNDHDVYTRYV